jgi:hypothetical protein
MPIKKARDTLIKTTTSAKTKASSKKTMTLDNPFESSSFASTLSSSIRVSTYPVRLLIKLSTLKNLAIESRSITFSL